MTNKKILIAAAWPYANGSLHLGHVAGLLGSDILARYFRLSGNQVLFVSGSDCHGTPISVEADRQGIAPEKIAAKYHQEFVENLIGGLGFSYDLYSKTTSPFHQKIVQDIFLQLYKRGDIYTKTEDLPYCINCKRFLPDRYIEGECPVCHFNPARGDQCDNCGTLLDPKDLIGPKCKICGGTPEWRPSEHFYLKLSRYQDKLTSWAKKSTGWRANAINFTINFLEQGLHDRAITRDTDWGIPVPLDGYEGKRIYVWFEAICGYLTTSQEWAANNKKSWQDWWQKKDALHYYVHGKDNIPFHAIIWPAILLGCGDLHLPDRIISSEYLTIESKQFSKSRHWAVWLPDFLSSFDGETIRYYLVANGPETSDADFSWSEYQARTNKELIGNFGNLIYRVLSFIKNNFPEGVDFPQKLSAEQAEFLQLAEATFPSTAKALEAAKFREALREVFKLIEAGNRFLDAAAPWTKIKSDQAQAAADLAVVGQAIKALAILINPFLPRSSEKIAAQIGLSNKDLQWQYPKTGKLMLVDPKPLYKHIEDSEVEAQRNKLGKA
ncbi:MAG: methionine--tRNA ligase [Patescibacteria group bacterium]